MTIEEICADYNRMYSTPRDIFKIRPRGCYVVETTGSIGIIPKGSKIIAEYFESGCHLRYYPDDSTQVVIDCTKEFMNSMVFDFNAKERSIVLSGISTEDLSEEIEARKCLVTS